MKVGDPWLCPQCGKNSFLKKESVLDGWKKVGDVLKCAACGAVAEEIPSDTPSAPSAEAPKKSADALAALLGGDDTVKVVNPLENEERKFCRDCKFRVANAFRMYCSKHERDVNPMDDCPDFLKR